MEKCIKNCKIGELNFKIGVNRDIARKAFRECPNYWNKLMQVKKTKNIENISEDGVIEFETMDSMFELQDSSITFAEVALPLMLEFSGEKLTSKEIFDYCKENDAYELVCQKVAEYCVEGFMNGATAKTPKIKIEM